MPSVWDYKAGKWVNISDDQVTSAVSGGEYQFPEGVVIPVWNPEGKPVGITGAEATQAFRNGYTYRQRGSTNDYLAQQYQESLREGASGIYGQAATLASNLASTMSFGASDVIARAIGGAGAAEAMRAANEVNPGLALTGAIGGAFMPLGAANLVGNAALKVGARVAGSANAMRAGSALERVGAKLGMGSMLNYGTRQGAQEAARLGIIGTGVKLGTAGVIEGAAQGVKETITKFALDYPDASMQTAIADIGMGAALGGGLGFGLGTVGKASAKIGKAALEWNRTKGPGKSVREFVRKNYPDIFSAIKRSDGETKAVFKRVFEDRELAVKMARNADNPEAVANEMMAKVDDLRRANRVIFEENEKAKAGLKAALNNAKVDTEKVTRSWVRLGTKLEKDIAKLEEYKVLPGGKYTEEMKAVIEKISGRLLEAKTPAQQHAALRDTLTDINQTIRKAKKARGIATEKDVEVLLDFRKEISKFSYKKDLWGKDIKIYEDTNRIWSNFIDSQDRLFGYKGYLMSKGPTGTMVLDKSKVMNALAAAARPKGENILNEIRLFENNADAMVAQLSSGKLPKGVDSVRLQDMLDSVKSAKAIVEDMYFVKLNNVLFNRQQSYTGRSMMAPFAAAMSGAGLGAFTPFGPTLGAMGALAGSALSSPIVMMRYAHGIGAAERGITNSVSQSLQRWWSNGKSSQRVKASLTAGVGASLYKTAKAFGGEKQRGESDLDFLSRTMTEYVDRPFRVEERARASLYGMSQTMPDEYVAAVNTMQRAVTFLASKTPRMSADQFSTKNETQAMAQMLKMQAYAAAVMQPKILLKELSEGAIKRETVEAVGYVYPEFLSGVQGMVMEDIASKNKKLNYYQKLELEKLLGMPATTGSKHLQIMQSALEKSRTQEQQPSRPRGESKAAQRDMSGSTALQYRRS